MDTARYVAALLLAAALPPAVGYWLAIHPAAAFWRRLGPRISLPLLLLLLLGATVLLASLHETLVFGDLGFRPWLLVPAVAIYAVSVALEVQCRRHLSLATLVGIPEMGGRSPGLLDRGIYGRVRHPRYLAVAVGVWPWALFANYVSAYLVAALTLPALWLVTVFEERELVERFGEAYEAYRRRVPRMVPRGRARAESAHPGDAALARDRSDS